MLPFQVKRFPGRSGDEVIVLTDRHGMPHFWPNVFVTAEYRNASKSPETAAKVLRALGMAAMWSRTHDRELDHDLTLGDFVKFEDVDDLADFLGLTAAEQELRLLKSQKPIALSNVVRLESVRPGRRPQRASDRPETNNLEIANRVRWVASYIEWHFNRRVGSLDRQNHDTDALRAIGPMVINRLIQLAPRVSSRSEDDVTLEGVDHEVMQRIEDALVPGSPGNPFRSDFVQARNYLIWRLLEDTGGRRHEVRTAEVDHVKYSQRRLEIHVSKTIRRTVPIGHKTAEAFDAFIEKFWSKLPKEARRRGHLFTDKDGRHLSLKAFNRLFERVRERVDGVPDFMAPHTIRRTWNDRFSEKIDAIPEDRRPSPEAETQLRNRLQGWSGESSMGGRYAKRHVKRKADQIAEAMMDGSVIPPNPIPVKPEDAE